MSEFEKVFGEGSNDWETDKLIAKIRNDFLSEITKHIPLGSAMSDPHCVLFAIYKILEKKKKKKNKK